MPSYIANILLFSTDGTNIGTSSETGRFFAGDREYVGKSWPVDVWRSATSSGPARSANGW